MIWKVFRRKKQQENTRESLEQLIGICQRILEGKWLDRGPGAMELEMELRSAIEEVKRAFNLKS